MTEFDRLREFFEDEADEAARRGYGVEIHLTHPNGLTETILRPARLREPVLTPHQRRTLAVGRDLTDDETARRLGVKRHSVRMARLRAADRMGVPRGKASVLREAVRLGEIPPA